MKASRQTENAKAEPPNPAELYANFLALRQQFQALEVENADWNVKKALLKKPRRWSKKRQLVPPAARVASSRPRGAQPGNRNRLKHGGRTREMQIFYAQVRTHIQSSDALIGWALSGVAR